MTTLLYPDLAGKHIDTYYLSKELASGGVARVWRAWDEGQHKEVAFKVFGVTPDTDISGMAARASAEIAAVQRLQHPHIATVYATGTIDDYVYIVMTLYEGGTLKDRLERMPRLTISAVCHIGWQVARALHHAHRHGVIHRDIKPANILLDIRHSGRVLVTDFGIAKIVNVPGVTHPGNAVGTADYSSPEQATAGELHQIDHRSDVYSLGCVLYEMLAWRRPFSGDNDMQIAYSHVHEDPPPITEFNPYAPPGLVAIINRMMAKDPRNRYYTAEVVAAALYPFIHDRGEGVL